MALSYIVFPGTPYYSNTALTTQAGTIVNTISATYVNTTYGTVSIGGSTYYVAYGQMISFWNSSFTGQQIDDAITKVRAASAVPASGGTDLFTTGGAYTLQTAAAAKADKDDLATIHQTSPTCTETNGIAAGAFFYLDGDLVMAKTAIANGATFTLGTNYEPPTAGGLNALKSALTSKYAAYKYSGATTQVKFKLNGLTSVNIYWFSVMLRTMSGFAQAFIQVNTDGSASFVQQSSGASGANFSSVSQSGGVLTINVGSIYSGVAIEQINIIDESAVLNIVPV